MRDRFFTFSRLGRYGRLGNQMFQVAAVLGAAHAHGARAVLPTWRCNYEGTLFSDVFENPVDQSLGSQVPTHRYEEKSFSYSPVPPPSGDTDMHGYFQSDRYFSGCEELVRHHFRPRRELLAAAAARHAGSIGQNACSVHVRRGDYVGNKAHDVVSTDYYDKAIAAAREDGFDRFLFFSDDVDWCRRTFSSSGFCFAESGGTAEDMFSMGLCRGNVIANSSYSWWGSWLNEHADKRVYAPARWFDEGYIKEYETVYRNDMRKIKYSI